MRRRFLSIERFLIGVIGDGLIHAALHGLAGGVERVERSLRLKMPFCDG